MPRVLVRPETKAKYLLLEHLDKEQKRTFKKFGWFEFKGSRGNLWRLCTREYLKLSQISDQGRLWNMTPQPGNGWGGYIYIYHNIWIGGNAVPECDNLLGLMIAMQANENWSTRGCTSGILVSQVKERDAERAKAAA